MHPGMDTAHGDGTNVYFPPVHVRSTHKTQWFGFAKCSSKLFLGFPVGILGLLWDFQLKSAWGCSETGPHAQTSGEGFP